jgi:hypothetical protein
MDARIDFITPELFYKVFIRKKYLKPSKLCPTKERYKKLREFNKS